jgi:hypothetical protein
MDPIPPYETKVHIGSDSLAGHLCSLGNGYTVTNPQAIFELLCLQDSSPTFQLTSLWRPEDGLEKVCLALPDNEVVSR